MTLNWWRIATFLAVIALIGLPIVVVVELGNRVASAVVSAGMIVLILWIISRRAQVDWDLFAETYDGTVTLTSAAVVVQVDGVESHYPWYAIENLTIVGQWRCLELATGLPNARQRILPVWRADSASKEITEFAMALDGQLASRDARSTSLEAIATVHEHGSLFPSWSVNCDLSAHEFDLSDIVRIGKRVTPSIATSVWFVLLAVLGATGAAMSLVEIANVWDAWKLEVYAFAWLLSSYFSMLMVYVAFSSYFEQRIEVTVAVSEMALSVSRKMCGTKVSWSKVAEVIEIEDYFLITDAHRQLIVAIPRDAFDAPETAMEFLAFVRRQHQAAQPWTDPATQVEIDADPKSLANPYRSPRES